MLDFLPWFLWFPWLKCLEIFGKVLMTDTPPEIQKILDEYFQALTRLDG